MPWKMCSISTTAGCDYLVVCHPFATPCNIFKAFRSSANLYTIYYRPDKFRPGLQASGPVSRLQAHHGPAGPTAITAHGYMIGYACMIFSATASYIKRSGSEITGSGPQVCFVTRYSVYLQRSSTSPYNPTNQKRTALYEVSKPITCRIHVSYKSYLEQLVLYISRSSQA
jgi:hypothetical protein